MFSQSALLFLQGTRSLPRNKNSKKSPKTQFCRFLVYAWWFAQASVHSWTVSMVRKQLELAYTQAVGIILNSKMAVSRRESGVFLGIQLGPQIERVVKHLLSPPFWIVPITAGNFSKPQWCGDSALVPSVEFHRFLPPPLPPFRILKRG